MTDEGRSLRGTRVGRIFQLLDAEVGAQGWAVLSDPGPAIASSEGDIDVLVGRADVKRVLTALAAADDLDVVNVVRHREGTAVFVIVSRATGGDGVHLDLHDVQNALEYDVTIEQARGSLERRFDERLGVELTYLGAGDARAVRQFRALVRAQSYSEFTTRLQRHGTDCGLSAEEFDRRRASALWRLRRPASTGLRYVGRALRPVGVVVAILGPDGVGKSTALEALGRAASRVVPAGALRFHLWASPPNLDSVPVTDPHAVSLRALPGSICQLCLWTIRSWTGWLRRVVPARARGRLVLFDRAPQDIVCDPVRYRNSTPRWLLRAWARAFPTPDLVVVLDAPVEHVLQRSAELEAAVVETMRDSYVGLATRRGWPVVDASQSRAEVEADLIRVLEEHLIERQHRRRSRRRVVRTNVPSPAS